jgi:hypothetical protein
MIVGGRRSRGRMGLRTVVVGPASRRRSHGHKDPAGRLAQRMAGEGERAQREGDGERDASQPERHDREHALHASSVAGSGIRPG